MIKIKSDKIIVGENLFDGFLYIENDKIVEVSTNDKTADEFFDFTGKYVSPGFIEIHTHGAGGYNFIYNTPEIIIKACEVHLLHGTTSILPTPATASFENLKKDSINIIKVMESKKCKANILGVHLEAPYLSMLQAGAQKPDYITAPIKEDYQPFLQEYGKYIKRWTYAPENDKNAEFCKCLVKHGVIPSVGHSDATYDQLKDAIECGLNSVTHLYSATSTITRDKGFRRLGIIETAFLHDDMKVEIIADGKHLPPELIKMIIKIKGTDNVMLVTDSMELAGTGIKDGTKGKTSGIDYIIEDGACKVADGSCFAGSMATADMLIRVVNKKVGYSIPTAVKMMTEVPAKFLGVNKGEIKAGKDADVIVFDDDVNVSNVFVLGKKVV